MNIVNVPPEILIHYLFPHLTFYELAMLTRTCTYLDEIIMAEYVSVLKDKFIELLNDMLINMEDPPIDQIIRYLSSNRGVLDFLGSFHASPRRTILPEIINILDDTFLGFFVRLDMTIPSHQYSRDDIYEDLNSRKVGVIRPYYKDYVIKVINHSQDIIITEDQNEEIDMTNIHKSRGYKRYQLLRKHKDRRLDEIIFMNITSN